MIMDVKAWIILALAVLVLIQADIIQSGDCVVSVTDRGGHHVYLVKGQYQAAFYNEHR
jgi:hypothetical protein